jgi:hypothetical protein
VYDDYEELFDYEKKEVKKKATGIAALLKIKKLGRKFRTNILKNISKKSKNNE